jgi:hypothetical protein
MQKQKSKLSGAKMRMLRWTREAQDKIGLETLLLERKLGSYHFKGGKMNLIFGGLDMNDQNICKED